MNQIFKKLNYKDSKYIHILNAPDEFGQVMDEMRTRSSIVSGLVGARQIAFFLAFVSRQKELDTLIKKVVPLLAEDGLLWFAYPKKSSKKYTCEFNRDTGWNALGERGFEPVRMVAIDNDWSALRFRKAENIKSMTRSFAMSDTGKKKVAAKKTASEKK